MPLRLLFAASGLAAVVLAGPPAGAFDGSGCGGNYTASASCVFAVRGSPLTIRGDSIAPAAHVHVFLTLEGYSEIPPVIECEAAKATYASCSEDYPDSATNAKLPPQVSTVYLRCNVQGAGKGQYYCQASVT